MKIMRAKTLAPSSEEYQDEQKEQGRSLSLSGDVWSFIQLYLFTGDRLAFNAVCRAWKSIQAPPLTLQLATHCPFFSSPSLLLPPPPHANSRTYLAFHSAYNSHYYIDIPEFKDAQIHCCKYSWLLMSAHNGRRLFFFNPFKKMNKNIEIPHPRFSANNFTALSFSSPPSSSDWSVFGIFQSVGNQNRMIIGFLKCGEENWRYGRVRNMCDFKVSNGSLVSDQHQYYCLDVKGRVAIFNTEQRNVVFSIGLGFGDSNSKLVDQSFLAGIGGEIFSVIVTHDSTKVSVYKLRGSTERWEPVKNLGNKMLFVSELASFGATATEKGMANKIYFSKFHGKNGIFYSLSTKKYHSYDGKFCSKEPYGLEEMTTGTWIQPSIES